MSLSSINADAILYDPAIPAVKPSKPNKMLLLVMVVMLAVVFCLIYVIVKVAMDNSVKTPDQMKKDWVWQYSVKSETLRGQESCTGT